MQRKGELTTQQLVVLIILIASFAILLFFLVRLNLGKTTETEVCHNSVILKGNSALPDDAIALDCKTNYVCLTKDGSCEGMTNPEIEKVRNEEETYEVLANQMTDCWWMFGEGRVNYVGKDFKENLYCSICSQISFDDSVDFFEGREISQREFYSYMADNNVPGKDVSYLKYLFDVEQVSDIEQTLVEEDLRFKEINLDMQQYAMMGIYSEVGVGGWIAAAAGTGGLIAAGLLLTPITSGASIGSVIGIISIGSSTVVGGALGYYAGIAIKGESGNDFMAPTIIEVNSETFEAFDCKDIKTLA